MDPAKLLSELLDTAPCTRPRATAASNEENAWPDSQWYAPHTPGAVNALYGAGSTDRTLLPIAAAVDAPGEPAADRARPPWVTAVLNKPAPWISLLLVVSALSLAASLWWRDHHRDAAGAGVATQAAAPGDPPAAPASPAPPAIAQPPAATAAAANPGTANPPVAGNDAALPGLSPEETSSPGSCSRAAVALALCDAEIHPIP
jgi:hypothetical protein